MIRIRAALPGDASAMCAVINPLIEAGGTIAHRQPFDPDRMAAHYVLSPRKVSCVVAVADGRIAGFQSLARPDPSWAGPNVIPQSWGVIASFVASGGHGRGIGRRMFAVTREAAESAGLVAIDATILRHNTGGLAFYGSLGFEEYCSDEERISKQFVISR